MMEKEEKKSLDISMQEIFSEIGMVRLSTRNWTSIHGIVVVVRENSLAHILAWNTLVRHT